MYIFNMFIEVKKNMVKKIEKYIYLDQSYNLTNYFMFNQISIHSDFLKLEVNSA